MKKLSTALLALTGSMLFAAPVDVKSISKDAKWVAHVDMEGLSSTEGFKIVTDYISSEVIMGMIPAKAKEKVDQKISKIDDIKSFTLYGNELKEGSGVFIYKGKVDAAEVQKKIDEHKPTKKTLDNGATALAWGGHKGKNLYTSQTDDNTLIFSADLKELTSAINVLSGTEGNIGESDSELSSKVTSIKNSLVFFTTDEMPQVGFGSRLLKSAKGITYTMNAEGEGVNNKTVVEFKTESDAQLILNMVEGFKAYGMTMTDKFPAAKLVLEKHKMGLEGSNLTSDLSYSYVELKDWLNVVTENLKTLKCIK